MNTLDRISKESKLLIDSAKDSATSRLLELRQSGGISIDEDTFSKILKIVTLSMEESYQRTLPHFQNTIKNYL